MMVLRTTIATTAALTRQVGYPLTALSAAIALVSVLSWPLAGWQGVAATAIFAANALYLAAVHDLAEWVDKQFATPPTTDLREVPR